MPNLIEKNNIDAAVLPALIMIPDISGFTEYMYNSDNIHCRYIIAELLEVILNSNMLDLSVSELEGDAVLFYKFGKPPKLEEIILQCNLIFNNFHKYIKQFAADKLCDCKCCDNANNLSLKFIIHYGKVSPVKIKTHEKLFGIDMILAHRLLKSNIQIREYILFSETYLMTQDRSELNQIIDWKQVESGTVSFQNFGLISYYYIDLSSLKEKIIIKKESFTIPKNKGEIKYKIYIDTPIDFVQEIVTNFKFKPNWISVLQDIRFEERTIPRIGAEHKCLMSDIFLKTILIDYSSIYINDNRSRYVEKLSNKYLGLNIYLTYFLKKKGLGTLLSMELSFVGKGIYTLFIKYLFKRRITKRRIRGSLAKLKFLSEEIYNKYNVNVTPHFYNNNEHI